MAEGVDLMGPSVLWIVAESLVIYATKPISKAKKQCSLLSLIIVFPCTAARLFTDTEAFENTFQLKIQTNKNLHTTLTQCTFKWVIKTNSLYRYDGEKIICSRWSDRLMTHDICTCVQVLTWALSYFLRLVMTRKWLMTWTQDRSFWIYGPLYNIYYF